MTYAFRIRFRIPEGQHIDHDEAELVLREGPERGVAIRPQTADMTVKQDHKFALRGAGYATAEDAAEDGERWVGALALGFVSEFLPADFEMRTAPSGFFSGALAAMSVDQGRAVYNDEPGLLVVPEHPTPVFARMESKVVVGRNALGTATAIRDVYEAHLQLDEKTLLALEMFSTAENMPEGDADSRFLMLMISVEALIEVKRRPEPQIAALDRLQANLARIGGLSPGDSEQLRNALGNLKDESIGSAGRRLADSVGDRTYFELSAIEFFRKCYNARSNLVHASTDRPDPALIRNLVGPLLRFVRDLIRLSAGVDWQHPREPS